MFRWLAVIGALVTLFACSEDDPVVKGNNPMRFAIIGVHEVEAPEPCWLLEVKVDDPDFDWGEVTQEVDGQPRSNWQVPYDEQPLDDGGKRWAFFFHYLDFTKPLLTPHGPVNVPKPTPRPAHLKSIEYDEP